MEAAGFEKLPRLWENGMRPLALAALLLSGAPMPPPVAAQEAAIVVRGDVRRLEIERILDADNVDTSRLGARAVADAMALIGRGRAPEDFWRAYRAHVSAWQRLAEAEESGRRPGAGGFTGAAALMKAQREIDTSFDEVERLARGYGARLPTPAWKRAPAAKT